MKMPHFLKMTLTIILTLLISSLIFSFASWIMLIIYEYSGVHFGNFITRLVDTAVGICFIFIILAIHVYFFRRPDKFLLRPVIESIAKIASGDFNVRIDDFMDKQEKKFFGGLVDSINRMAENLEEMEKLRQEFVSDVSHEIQTPLTSIKGFAKALQNEGIDPEKKSHYLSIIETECTRLSGITDNLLRLASLESGKLAYTPRRFRLDTQIRNIVINCEPQWSRKKLNFEVMLDKTEILADEDLLSQVWLNLIGNSIKFTPEGGNIELSLQVNNNEAEFRIKDSGIGISREDQPRIFERFFKSDISRQRTNEGSGLGLSIVKKIVEICKGHIYVSSSPGQGAMFYVILPLIP